MSFGPGLTRTVKWILGIELAAFLIYLFVGAATQARLDGWLRLTPIDLGHGQVWKLATTILMQDRPLAFFFDMLMLWMFVPVLEQHWGHRRFLRFFVVTSLVANAVSAGVGLLLGGTNMMVPISGISPFIYASIAAYGVVFANQSVQLFGVVPIKGKVLAIGIACVVALFVLIEGKWVLGAGYFAAMGLAVAMTRGLWTPNLWWLKLRRWRIRRKYQVIDGGARTTRDKKNQWLN